MKTNDPGHRDEQISKVLKEWRSDVPLPPRFQEQVWRRITLAERLPSPSSSLATLVAHWVATVLPRPALATAYLTLLVAVGASVGWTRARYETARVDSDLRARYVQAVDPYQATP